MTATSKFFTTMAVLFIANALPAQVNQQGTVHLAGGIDLGAHATEYEQTVRIVNINVTSKETDGAVTVTVPIDFQYGVSNAFSIGAYIQPGGYLDSNATRTNGLVLLGVRPRVYIVNNDNFTWFADAQFGANTLQINDEDGQFKTEARYAGTHFGIGSGVGVYFGGVTGLNFRLGYMGAGFDLKDYSQNGNSVALNDFDAKLTTSGVLLSIQLAFRL